MRRLKRKKRLTALLLCMLLLIGSVPASASEDTEQGQAGAGLSTSVDTTYEYEVSEADEGISSERPPELILGDTEEPQEDAGEEELKEAEQAEEELQEQREIEQPLEEETEEPGPPAAPLRVSLNPGRSAVSPEHHKYVRDNKDGTYTLTLNVKGMYDSTIHKPELDVLLIVDVSNSMDAPYGSSRTSRLKTVKDIVTGPNGLSDAILGNDEIIGRMAVVSYSGSKGSRNNPDIAWNDADTVQSWTPSKAILDASVSRLSTNGGTNCQAGLYEAAKVLAGSNGNAQKAVIFLSDGQPTYYYDSNGKTQGTGNSDNNGYCADAAYNQASSVSGLSGFYTVGIATDVSIDFLTNLANSSTAKNKAAYSAATSFDLAKIFKEITADITEYTCRGITITDILSDYVQIPSSGLQGKVSKIDGNQAETDLTDMVKLSSDGKTITADFPDAYVLDRDSTYSFNFLVEPTQKAFDEYADTLYNNPNGSGYPHMGSGNSDAPGNTTSSNQPGFYSNAAAALRYTYGIEGADPATAEYVEKPVVQVSDQEIPVTKYWKDVPDDITKPEVTVNLYQDNKTDIYRTITLRGENDETAWKGNFTHISKGHEYHIEEVQLPGYKTPVITGNSKEGFVITNTYDLTEVTVTKVWEDNGNEDGKRPESIQVQLKNGNSSVGAPVTIGKNQEGTITSEDGNRWSYTWKNLPKSDKNGAIHYTVEEVTQLSDYETTYSEDTLTITNTRKPSLTIAKTVEGDMGDRTKDFRFTVTLKNKNGEPLSGSYSYTRTNEDEPEVQEGILKLNPEGEVEFSLKHGDSITIKNLPIGTSYQVAENPEDAEGYQISYDAAENGKLFNKNVQVAVTNKKDMIPVTGLEDIKKGWSLVILLCVPISMGMIFWLIHRKRFEV